jgi:hypothetical protein
MNGATPSQGALQVVLQRASPAVPHTATILAAASSGGRTSEVPTPFYDHLMSMIHATALENGRSAQHGVGDAVSHAAHPRWRIHPLIFCIAGLIVVAATGRVLFAPEVSQRQPPIHTSRVFDKASPSGELAEKAAPEDLKGSDFEGKRKVEGGIGVEPVADAKSDERPLDGAEESIANPKSEQPPPEDLPSPRAIDTGSPGRTDDPPAIRIARVVSDVKMRAGPSNVQSVLATISRGSSVEVINCRQWCEVIFAGQRGWVYGSFIGGH